MKSSTTVITAVLLVCLSAGLYLAAGPENPQSVENAPTSEAPVAPPLPPAPYVTKNMPPPRISELRNPSGCLEIAGDRYKGDETEAFGKEPREGVTVFNGCKEEIVIVDVKANDTNIAYVSSILPSRAILRAKSAKQEKDLLLAISRSGARCDLEGIEGRVCRLIALPPGRNMFFSIPVKHWFSIPLKDGRLITGYLLEPVDPKAPPKPREVPKMPDKGFKFKRL